MDVDDVDTSTDARPGMPSIGFGVGQFGVEPGHSARVARIPSLGVGLS
jgi:hypothetical protein